MPFTATKPFVVSKLFHKAGEGSGGGEAVITSLSVTPTTSAQTITAPSGTDGYSPVNVEAVTSAIDENIVAGNIKSGVTILGVSGNVVELRGETKIITPRTYAQTVYPTNPNNGITQVTVPAVTNTIDANIAAGNIKDGVTILGVTGDYQGQTPTGTKNITTNGTHDVAAYEYADVQVPTTAPDYYILKTKNSSGTLTAASTIMDFTGLTGLGTNAGPYAYYANTYAGPLDMSSIKTISGGGSDYSNYGCAYMFAQCRSITSVDLSGLEEISGINNTGTAGCQSMFYYCTGLISVNMQNLKNISGCTSSMFYSCNHLTSVDLSSLEKVSGNAGSMFGGCSALTSISLPKLKNMYDTRESSYVFQNCTSLTSASIPKLVVVSKPCARVFSGCSSLTTVDLSSLTLLTGYNRSYNYTFGGCRALTSFTYDSLVLCEGLMTYNFQNCTSLTTLNYPKLILCDALYDSNYANMLSGCSGVTVHFPSNLQTKMSTWNSVTNGFGGTNTTVLFDLPSTAGVVDLTKITHLYSGDISSNLFQGATDATKFDFSGLVYLNSSMQNTFSNDTTVTAFDFSGLETVGDSGSFNTTFSYTGITSMRFDRLREIQPTSTSGGSGVLQNAFYGCSSLTDVYFPAVVKVGTSGIYRKFTNMLAGTSGVTVHLPSNFLPDVTTATLATTMGGTNTTVLKDLPAAVTLTGADTKEYIRNPKFDTATALSWYIIGSDTPYYTSTTADPVVGDTIYSDAACTVAVTTISSIA